MTWTLGLLALLVSTGAGFVWGYERHVRSYTQHLRDRLVRLTFAGAVCLSIYSGPIYLVYRHYSNTSDIQIKQLPFWMWPSLVVLVLLPWVSGECVGYLKNKNVNKEKDTKKGKSSSITIPTGFDYVMDHVRDDTITVMLYVTLKNGPFIIGCLKRGAVTPHVLDMYLYPIYYQGPMDSKFNAHSDPEELLDQYDSGVLIRYEDVACINVRIVPKEEEQEE